MNAYALFSAILNCISGITLFALLIYFKTRHKFLIFFNFSIAFWSFFYILWQYNLGGHNALYISLLTLGSVWLPWTFLGFSFSDLGRKNLSLYKRINTFFWGPLTLIPLLLSMLAFTPHIVKTIEPFREFPFWPMAGDLLWFHILYFFAYVLISAFLVYKTYGNTLISTYIIGATLIGFSGGATNFLYWYKIPIPPFGNIAVTLYAIILGYAILKHRLLDINIALSQTIAKFFTLLIFIASGFILIRLYYRIIPFEDIWTNLLASSIFLAITYELYPWLRAKIQTLPDKYLVKRHFNFEDVSWSITQSLNSCIQLNEVTPIIQQAIKNDMKLDLIDLYIPQHFDNSQSLSKSMVKWDFEANAETDQILDPTEPIFKSSLDHRQVLTIDLSDSESLLTSFYAQKAGACIPLISKDELVGLIVVSQRTDIPRYTYDDTKMFEFLSPQLGLALDRLRAYNKALAGMTHLQKSASILGMMNFYTHDIKAPLVSIKSIIDTVPELTQKIKTSINDQVHRILDLVKTMLDIAKGNHERNPKPLYLPELLENVFKFYKCNISVAGNWQDPVPRYPVMGEFNDLLVLFTNIIKNANEALADQIDSKPQLLINIDTHPTPHTHQISITDNGPGIPPEQLAKLFEFTLSTKMDGSGVGLQAIKSIARDHNATINVTSTLGTGTTFIVTIPYMQAEPPKIYQIPPPSPKDDSLPTGASEATQDYNTSVAHIISGLGVAVREEQSDSRQDECIALSQVGEPEGALAAELGSLQRSILIIDDDPEIQHMYTYKLKNHPYFLTFANDGESGLSLLQTSKFDIILLDLNMPNMNGHQFLKCLKQTQIGDNIPTIVCSGENPEEIQEKLKIYPNFIGCISKLCETNELIDAIELAIQHPKKEK